MEQIILDKKNIYDIENGKDKFIFISYAHDDHESTNADIQQFSKFGVRLWFDTSLEHGEDWKQQAKDSMTLENCIGFCCYLSPASVASEAVAWEVETALAIKKANPAFAIYSVNLGGESAFRLLKAAEGRLGTRAERHYRLFLEAFPEEVIHFNRGSDPTDFKHIHQVIKQFEKIGARDTKVNYSAPEEFSYIPHRDGIKIIGYRGESAYPNVPSEIGGKRVLALGMEVFAKCPNAAELKSVILQEGVEEIDERCFADCKQLESVSLPVSLRTVAYEAFRGCAALASVTFHKHIRRVGDYCFYLCNNLKSVVFNAACKDVSLGFNCFQECEDLTDVVLPKSVAEMSMYCFNKCENLETLRLPEHIGKLAETVIHNCPALKRLEVCGPLPEGYTGGMIKHCARLEEFVSFDGRLPDALLGTLRTGGTNIAVRLAPPAPSFDESDMTVTFPHVPDASGYTAEISANENGKTVTYTAAVRPSLANGQCVCKAKTDGQGRIAFVPAEDGGNVGGSFTFRLRADGDGEAFESSPFSAEVRYRNKATDFVSSPSDPAVLAAYNGVEEEVVVPERFEVIGDGAFAYCDTLCAVRFPSRLRAIGNRAFFHCKNLREIGWEDTDLEKIGDQAFAYCGGLTELRFPRSLDEIGKEAFQVCDGIETVDFSASFVRKISESAFRRCIKLKTVRFSSNCTTVAAKAFRGCTALLPTDLPTDLKTVGASAFSFLMDAEEIVLPAAVRDVASDFLHYSTGVKRIRFDGEPKHYCIKNETLLTDDSRDAVTFPINAEVETYVLPDGVKCIRREAFRDLENVRTAELDGELERVDADNFSFCWNLERAVLGKSVTALGDNCFSHNPKLREVVITSEQLPAVGAHCFVKNNDDLCIVFRGVPYRNKPDKLSAWDYLHSLFGK